MIPADESNNQEKNVKKKENTQDRSRNASSLPSDSMNQEANDKEKENLSDGSWNIPPPPKYSKLRPRVSSSSTPLLPRRRSKTRLRSTPSNTKKYNFESTRRLFWGDDQSSSVDLNSSFPGNDSSFDKDHRPTGWTGFFFGFMYEEPFDDSIDYGNDEEESSGHSTWNPLNFALFISYTLTSAAAVTPVLLVPTIGQEFLSSSEEASLFTSRAASFAVLGTACGKFLNGPVGDVLGARRTSVLYSFLLCFSLTALAACQDATSAAWCCFFVEFFQSVQWPCIIVMLATHYGTNHNTYEAGIYVTSIASRFGPLFAIPMLSFFLRQASWRLVAVIGGWTALIGSSVAYLFLTDSPHQINEPQNALQPSLLAQLQKSNFYTRPRQFVGVMAVVLYSVIRTNLIPSLKRVLNSGTFWIVALAHTGSSMVRTSDRILGSYFLETSMGHLTEETSGGLVVYSILGTVFGLVIAGNMFAVRKERQRKWLVSRLYMTTIGACYFLALLAVPRLRRAIDAPDLILFFQVVASFVMSFGISVMYYHIPGIVGSAFGNNKGLFAAYTDGVAYGIASVLWKFVAAAVANGNDDGGGWAYGWAAVALLIVLCAILMVEFLEHYFVRASGRNYGTYETILLA